MLTLRRVVLFTFALGSAAALHAQSIDVTGTWSGQIQGTKNCSGGGTVTNKATITLNLQQSGSSVSGTGSVVAPHDPCVAGSPNDTVPITSMSGSISGSQAGGTATVLTTEAGPQTTIWSATVSGNTMNLSILAGPSGNLTGTLTKAAAPGSEITGGWGGTFSASEGCSTQTSTVTQQWTSPASFSVTQSGSTLSGVVLLTEVPDHDERCQVAGVHSSSLAFNGTISGNTISGTAQAENVLSVSGTVSGSSMTLNFTSTGHKSLTATASLTRGSSTPPDTHLSGNYSGTLADTILPCGKPPAVTHSGTIDGTISQFGAAFSGTFTLTGLLKDQQDSTGKCNVIQESGSGLVTGQISGNTLTGRVFSPNDDKEHPFTATIDGNTISGRFAGDFAGEGITFTMTKSGSTPNPPQVNSFTANPPTIRAGQRTTLSWTTSGAVVVSIDNGIGGQSTAGSIDVSPAATTTYTLTANNGSQPVTATATVTVLTGPIVNVTSLPATMLEIAGSGGVTTSYAITNSGSASTTITLGQSQGFFSQSPSTFTLDAGATQTITITGSAQAAGTYEAFSTISGNGVPSGLQVPVKLLAAAPPAGTVTADPTAARVDVAAAASSSPAGSVAFKNNGTARLTGVLNSDVPWIIPQTGSVNIDPGQTATFNFLVDRSKRPDASALNGSLEGSLTLSFLTPSGSTFAKTKLDGNPTNVSVTIVKVVDTVQPPVTTAGIPALAQGELALFVAGVGHVIGVGGAQFASDVSILNPQGNKSVDDVKMYYTASTSATSASKTTSLNSVPGQVSVALADVVKTVFSGTDERGTLQIRSKDADKLATSATVLTTNNPAGTFGNTIPILRSDRAIVANDAMVISGVRKDGTTHTNLYVQEAGGSDGSVQIDFLGADGSTVSTRTDNISAFKLLPLDNVVPANAVAVAITNKSTGSAKFLAYATPVDERSNDTWAIADWGKAFGYGASDAVILPVAGSVHGANNTFYRTDLSLTNRGTDAASGTLRYVSRTGATFGQDISIGGKSTKTMNDVISTFNVSGDTVGYLMYTPLSGSVSLSSRTYTTVGSKPDTFGSGVPAVAAGSALQLGGTRPIAGLADASRSTVIAGKPATYRTNFGLMETTGHPVTVRVTFRFTFPAGAKAQGIGGATRDYALNGNQFLLLNSIAGEILGAARLQYGDLSNVEADFQVLDGAGAVMLFTSSVDNATGDSILRTE